MLSTSTPIITTLFATLLLAGCASGTLPVDRYELQDLQRSVANQRADLTYLRVTGDVRHREMVDLQTDSTQQILDAIADKVKPPTCPPQPQPRECASVAQQDSGNSARYRGKLVVGEVEKAFLMGPNFIYDARIDSGAETSSMDARNVRRFERDGQDWVRFDVPVPGKDGELKTLERKISRNVRIIQANQEGEDDYDRRPVVELQFRIGDHEQKAEFTLTDRSHLTYTLLIGRNILRDVMLIDVGKEYSTELPRAVLTSAIQDND